ncbi:putative mitochondrial 2-oxodicarboxylate carrier [Venturia nashicola]|uniref:Putative mitochondrial 2-oxodicarboxylate carrier n=1 Tax=Venturia nashicola TaxID=86259 RepID=A0A4Z1P574_9PEZI|nr:putative mitochondrial 2-oxodicarboxylate carrier [Venturia nashicola]
MSSTNAPKKITAATTIVFLKQDSSKKSFSDLPGELRNNIYRLCLVNPIPIVLDVLERKARVYYEDNNVKGAYKPYRDVTTALLRTCKATNAETTPILLGENTFVIDVGGRWVFDDIPSHPQPFPNLALIRRLVIRFQLPSELILIRSGNIQDRLATLKNVFERIEHLHFCAVETHSRGGRVGAYIPKEWVELLDGFLTMVSSAKATQEIFIPLSHGTFDSVPENLWKENSERASPNSDLPAPPEWCPPAFSCTDWGAFSLWASGPNPSTRIKSPACTCSKVLNPIIDRLKPKITRECHHSGEKVHSLTEYH